MNKDNISFATPDDDWNNWRDEEILRDARYDELHPDDDEFENN